MLELIQRLTGDPALIALIGAGHVYAVETDYMGECLIYEFHTLQDDKCARLVRLKITAICATLDKTCQVEARIRALILTLGDNPLTDGITSVALNGGGLLRDAAREKYHRIMYFDVIMKSQEGT